MKRYLVFTMYAYYPGGGWDDFVGDAATVAEATEIAASNARDFQQIIDTEDMEEVDVEQLDRKNPND